MFEVSSCSSYSEERQWFFCNEQVYFGVGGYRSVFVVTRVKYNDEEDV